MTKAKAKQSEKEKMLAGLLYDPGEAVLTEDRERAKDLCHKYNQLLPSKRDERITLLKKLNHRSR